MDNEQKQKVITDALLKAFSLGQQYWRQADSERLSDYPKAEVTRMKFKQLIHDTTLLII